METNLDQFWLNPRLHLKDLEQRVDEVLVHLAEDDGGGGGDAPHPQAHPNHLIMLLLLLLMMFSI